jgi:hypothetical protein
MVKFVYRRLSKPATVFEKMIFIGALSKSSALIAAPSALNLSLPPCATSEALSLYLFPTILALCWTGLFQRWSYLRFQHHKRRRLPADFPLEVIAECAWLIGLYIFRCFAEKLLYL